MKRTARSLHKHELYQISVQNPEFERRLLQRIYGKLRGKQPRKLREDFCGTAFLSCEWVRRVRDGEAQAIDLDRETLEWGRKHNARDLGESAGRLHLVHDDVLDVGGDFVPDIVVAFNFSYFVLKNRELLLRYFRGVCEALAEDGILVIDIYGGSEAQVIQEETTKQDEGFDYVWEQARYNPLTGDYLCHIHFDFPDGRRIKKAYTYDWRLWHLPEVLDILRDAGFRDHTVYWEGTDSSDGGGNGVYRPTTRGDDSVSWVAYVVAVK